VCRRELSNAGTEKAFPATLFGAHQREKMDLERSCKAFIPAFTESYPRLAEMIFGTGRRSTISSSDRQYAVRRYSETVQPISHRDTAGCATRSRFTAQRI